MKTLAKFLGALLALGTVTHLPAQEPAPDPMIAAAARFDATQLDQLLGPIALYPDALVALILPASAASSDVVLAARYLRDGGDPTQTDSQPWDESVRALARYPEVIKWMDENLAWTKQLGEAFVAQPGEIMNAVQRLRAQAQAAGSLTSTPQQQVVVEQSVISIVPTQPDVIYVPYYDPAVVYVSRPGYYYNNTPFVTFGSPYSAGFWLSYNIDWGYRRVCYVNYYDRQRAWRDHQDYWRRPYFSNRPGHVPLPSVAWTPRTNSNYGFHPGYAPRNAAPVSPAQVSTTNAATWQNRHDGHRDYNNGPRTTQTTSVPNNLPNAAFARGAITAAPALPSAPTPQLRLNNPLPQTLPAPLPSVQAQNTRPTTGSWARPSNPDYSNHNQTRYHAPSQPAPSTPSYHPNPLPAAPALQTANSYSHAPHYQAPAPAAPVVSAPPVQSAPQAQAGAPATNNGGGSRGSDNGQYRGRDRNER